MHCCTVYIYVYTGLSMYIVQYTHAINSIVNVYYYIQVYTMQRNGNVLLDKKTRHTYIKECLKVHKMPRPTKQNVVSPHIVNHCNLALCPLRILVSADLLIPILNISISIQQRLCYTVYRIQHTSISRFADINTQHTSIQYSR